MAATPKVLIPDKEIDCIGLFCPIPIVRTREAIWEMSVGELLAMLSDEVGRFDSACAAAAKVPNAALVFLTTDVPKPESQPRR